MNTEKVHDEQISPLMRQIIDLCKEHSIPFVASFQLKDESEQGLLCISSFLPEGSDRVLRVTESFIKNNTRRCTEV